ncbi:MAG: helix-turn-helix domain-containing protein [Halodesulfurarchaeum sp.]|nr:helix-turn-helix domain-containing protein [Halodesulfurarchaeum sp.]
MPIHLESHDSDVNLTPGTTKSDIVVMLYTNPKLGFRPAEISEALDIPRGTATTTVKRLCEQGYIEKTDNSYYHAIDHREDLRRYVGSLDQLERLFDRPPTTTTEDASGQATIDESALEAEVKSIESDLE